MVNIYTAQTMLHSIKNCILHKIHLFHNEIIEKMRLSLEKRMQKCNGKSYHGKGQKFCDFILVIFTMMVNWMLPQDHYNLDICVMSSPSMVPVPYCWLNQTHEQSNRSVCNRYWRAAPEIGKRVKILASSIWSRFKISWDMTLLMDECFMMLWTNKVPSSSALKQFNNNILLKCQEPLTQRHSITSQKTWIVSNITVRTSHLMQHFIINNGTHMPLHHTTAHPQSADKWDGLHRRGHTGKWDMQHKWDMEHNRACSTNEAHRVMSHAANIEHSAQLDM